MQVNVSVELGNDSMTMTPDEMAAAILAAVGGDPARDTVTLRVHAAAEAGVPTNPPLPT